MAATSHPLRTLSLALFVGSLAGGVLTAFVLVVGFGMTGAGHGDSTVWYAGLGLWLISWLALLISCVLGIEAWATTRRASWWVVPGLLILLATGAIGLWGMQG